jgi:ribosomal protein L24E
MARCLVLIVALLSLAGGPARSADTPRKAPKEALQVFNDLIGSWRGTGEPSGTREAKQRGFWVEKIAWQWRFKDDVHLEAAFDKGRHFRKVELRYLPERDLYQLTAHTPSGEKLVFEGPLEKRRLTLERKDEGKGETQRLVVTLLHANRYLYRYEVRPADGGSFKALYQVGATKEGVPFASTEGVEPECVVSGGLGTMPVQYKGRTFYVCCSGCADAFKDDPEKYIKEFEARKKKKGQ